MSRNRHPVPPLAKPLTASLQTTFEQDAASYQFAGYEQAVALGPEHAEVYYNRAMALKDQKRFDEALARFDKAIALKGDYAEAHNGRGIVLANLNRPADAIAAFDKAIALKSDYAQAYNNRGNVLQDLQYFADALAAFDKAIDLQPDNASVHNNRGVVLHDLKRLDDALASHDRAIALKPDYAEAYYNRGIVLQDLQLLDDALATFDQAIALQRGYAAAHNNRGVVLQDLRRLDDALAAYETAIALTGGFAEAYTNQSHCLLQMGRFAEGWRLHEWRKKTERPVGDRRFPQPLWLGNENLANKTVFIHWEQGFGDTIQFCRYGKLLKLRGAEVVMSVQQPLYQLLKQMNPDIHVINQDEPPAAFDYHCPLMSLPLAFATTLENIPSEPYIFPDKGLRKVWDIRLPRTKPRIGVVWSGSARQRNDRNRSIGLAAFAPLLSSDAHWISLQKELREGDFALLQELPQVVHYGDQLRNFSDTAAVIDLSDLVITVDTSVAHLAGAMGKQVWILLAFNADWRWLADRDDSPWYPTARLFRQDELGSWENVIARVHAALRDFIHARS